MQLQLLDYYVAAQLRPLILWCNPEYNANWINTELSISGRSVQSFKQVFDNRLVRYPESKGLFFFRYMVRLCEEVSDPERDEIT